MGSGNSGISTGAIIAIVIVAVVLFLIICIVGWYISTMNKLRRMNVKVDETESGIDVALTKRFDLLTKMVETVKGYAKHESDTLAKVIEMRKPASGATVAEKQEFANIQTDAFKSLNFVAEQYPDLKANQNFRELQNSISEAEEHLQAARRLYNSNVSILNQRIVSFPTSFVASRCGIIQRDFFEADSYKREDVDIKF